MKDPKSLTKIISQVLIALFIGILLFYFFKAFVTKPFEGDSLTYHIPIAESIIDGSFISPSFTVDQEYFPGSSEVILAAFIILGIPLNIFNVFAIILLALGCYKLFLMFSYNKHTALIFAVAISTVNVVLRWVETQTVDIWVGVFFVFALTVLVKPLINIKDYLLLGLNFGMLAGSKYSGVLFAGILLLLYWKNFTWHINFRKLFAFLIPIIILALPWYIRNWVAIGNPIYPLDSFLFKGNIQNPILGTQVWSSYVLNPKSTFDAFVSEYMLWSFALLWAGVVLIKNVIVKIREKNIEIKLLILGAINFLVFLILPSWDAYLIRVSTLRYSYPVIIPVILAFFLHFQTTKYRNLLGVAVLASILAIFAPEYHPKALLLVFAAIVVVYNMVHKTR